MAPPRARVALLSFLVLSVSMVSSCGTYTHGLVGAPLQAVLVIAPSQAVLVGGESLQFTATSNGNYISPATWMVNGVVGGSSATGRISRDGLYRAPLRIPEQSVSVVAVDTSSGVQSTPVPVQFFNPGNFAPGTVSPTNNPLVALYNFLAPADASVQIQFGPDTSYGLQTWVQPAPYGGGAVNILVAGMRASTAYHMKALVQLVDGTQLSDSDHVFTTGALPVSALPNLAVQQASTPASAPGVELLCLVSSSSGSQLTALATDLAGNVVWYYNIGPGEWPYPMKLLPNGHFLVVAAPATNSQGQISPNSAGVNEVREIDLAGNIINRITLDDINQALTVFGASFQLQSLHHDILQLPNGHLILLGNYTETVNDLPGQPAGTAVIGDALVDWDPVQGPVWTWSAFDHLNVSRAPYGNEDWTHANAVIYSPDDRNILLSLRNQNWILKINYIDGLGDGSVLWRFGYEGDFTLPASEAPIEWNYGQHYPTFVSPSSAGDFRLMFFNNGNARLVNNSGTVCGSIGVTACYSSVPVFDVNESSKRAQVQYEVNLSPTYSICCGDALILSNGNVEYDVADDLLTPGVSFVQEVTQEQSPQLLWQMNISGQLAYRAFRIPSLYPGIEWSQSALAAVSAAADSQSRDRRR
jgi:arylsulfate sulfotransferase